ncbi:hypothetical protein K470DRAFT_267488 [Piedraia hortae CBS 480.64]|uniref:DUF7492 domain-containing protein n=1 Tax=Piedraia hortae CBS 480.64 TaxID=1314780 RepID=A0A6A7C970_9PEZI|nr:hypothetical protein K470DRAFT_267488 [Piedraia hortae CBS 480.64]
MFSNVNFLTLVSGLLSLAGPAFGHSWIDEFQVIGSSDSYTGKRGFPRGYPMLQAQSGSCVAMKHLENGHATLPWNQLGKPKTGGTVFIYGTTQMSESKKMVDVHQWTKDGKGGNGLGFLMAAQIYDDGPLSQPCPGPAHIQPREMVREQCPDPSILAGGGKDEYYTTCADFNVVNSVPLPAASHTLAQGNPQTAAVSNFRTAYTTSPAVIMMSGTKTIGATLATATQYGACTNPTPAPVPASYSPVAVFDGAAYTSALKMNKQLAGLTQSLGAATAQPTSVATVCYGSASATDGASMIQALGPQPPGTYLSWALQERCFRHWGPSTGSM